MDRDYWEQIAERYEDEVFRVSEQDRGGLVQERLRQFAAQGARNALDLGCGMGLWLPLLGRLYRTVTAVDISAGLLRKARSLCRGLKHVRFVRADVCRSLKGVPKVEVVLCVNAILMPSMALRRAMFHAAADRLRVGGKLVLVVPSLESALLTKRRLIDWNVEDGMTPGAAVRSALEPERSAAVGWLRGVVPVAGIPTKHYLREELEAGLKSFRLQPVEILKLQYGWRTEFQEPPAWMQEPYPWDWLVVARRVAGRKAGTRI